MRDHQAWIRISIVAQAACRALADLHGAPENPFRQKEMDSKDMKAVQSALSEVTSTQRTVLDSTVRAPCWLTLSLSLYSMAVPLC